MMMCSKCKKRPAVLFISSMTAGERKSEGLCIKCAKELGLPQVEEYLQQMGISEDDFDNAVNSIFGDDSITDSDEFGDEYDDDYYDKHGIEYDKSQFPDPVEEDEHHSSEED